MAYFKYKQVADQLLETITDGTYKPGDRIPKEDELSAQFGVGRQTIRKAVEQLEETGHLKRIQGSGTYVCDADTAGPDGQEAGAAPALRTGNPGMIALVMMNSENYIFMDLMHGISDYLMEQGYVLTTMVTDGDYERERLALQNLLQNPPAGILLEPVWPRILSVNGPLLREVASKIPSLLLHSDATELFPAYPLRDRDGMRSMTDYLISLGHRKLGTIFAFDEATGQNRYLGCLESMRAHGIAIQQKHAVWFEHTEAADLFSPGGSIALDRMLEDVTAVLCHDDRIAYRLVQYLQTKGLRVPEDISVAGYDDSDYASLELPLTTIRHPGAEYGRRAAEMLLNMIRRPDHSVSDIAVPEPELVIRASTAPPRM